MTINDACDYIIIKLKTAGLTLNLLKLQKLLYYAQAWHLAIYGSPLFAGRFQAWVHGPVNREIYNRFAMTKSLYSEVGPGDVSGTFDIEKLDPREATHINNVLDVYAQYLGSQLEDLTHSEEPWTEAREGYSPSARCEREISEETMRRYYAERLK